MNVEEFLKLKRDYEDAIRRDGKKLFKSLIEEFFKNNSATFSKVAWTQYTPYFMDGDPCVFDVNEFCYCPNGQEQEFDDCHYDFESYSIKKKNKETKETLIAFESKLHSLGTDVFLSIFGDHVKVTAALDPNTSEVTFQIDEFEHD